MVVLICSALCVASCENTGKAMLGQVRHVVVVSLILVTPCSRVTQLCVPGDTWPVDDRALRMQNGTDACTSAFVAGRSANELTSMER